MLGSVTAEKTVFRSEPKKFNKFCLSNRPKLGTRNLKKETLTITHHVSIEDHGTYISQ